MLLLARKLVQLAFKRCRVLHSGKYLLAVQKLPIGGYNRSLGVVFAHKFKRGCKFFTARNVGVAEHYASRALDLVVEKLAEVFHIYFAFVCVHNGGKRVDFAVIQPRAFHSLDYIGKFTNAGGLYQNSVWLVLAYNLFQSLGKVAHKRTADTAGIELVYLYARLLHKAAVNTYFTELVFN